MEKNKLNIGLYYTNQSVEEDDANLKAISRFAYAFKVLLRTAYKKEAIYISSDLKPDIVDLAKPKPQVALIFVDEGTDKETFNKIKENIGEENTFCICFRNDIYEELRKKFASRLIPMFYRKPDGNAVTFYSLSSVGSLENQLFLKVYDLIDTINENISKTRLGNSKKETIYLALTDERLSEERNILKRELKRLGYHVAPEAEKLNGNLNSQLKKDIEKSSLSIHLILPGEISDKSNLLLANQNELSLNRHKDSGDFSRILWIAKPENDQEQESIKMLKENPDTFVGAEVLQNSIETLRGLLKHKLNYNHHIVNHKNGQSTDELSIYLLYDKIDEKGANELIDKLSVNKQSLLVPVFKGDFHTLRNHHINCLQKADIVVVYADAVNAVWLQMKFLEILKSPGMGRSKKWIDQIIYLENNSQNIGWLTQKHDITVLENDIHTLKMRIESGKKMLSHEGSI